MTLRARLVVLLVAPLAFAPGCDRSTHSPDPNGPQIERHDLNVGQQAGLDNPTGSPCASGKECPIGQGCGDDGACHVDGECATDSDCASTQICYPSDPSIAAGFCGSTRPATDPYCRSDGEGACRSTCSDDNDCGTGLSCVSGFCHWLDECTVDSDCTPNHTCQPRLGLDDYGYSECTAVDDPTCTPQPDGTCRFACESDEDCLVGGGCGPDHLCHASNECKADADCTSPLVCYPHENFGGLCGADR